MSTTTTNQFPAIGLWEAGIPTASELVPLTQSLIPPSLAQAFGIPILDTNFTIPSLTPFLAQSESNVSAEPVNSTVFPSNISSQVANNILSHLKSSDGTSTTPVVQVSSAVNSQFSHQHQAEWDRANASNVAAQNMSTHLASVYQTGPQIQFPHPLAPSNVPTSYNHQLQQFMQLMPDRANYINGANPFNSGQPTFHASSVPNFNQGQRVPFEHVPFTGQHNVQTLHHIPPLAHSQQPSHPPVMATPIPRPVYPSGPAPPANANQGQGQGNAAHEGSIDPPYLDEEGCGGATVARALKRPRVVWTPALHNRFQEALVKLGPEKAVPKTIMQYMNVEGLTRENVASHLQKYRLQAGRPRGNMMDGGDMDGDGDDDGELDEGACNQYNS